MSHNLSTFVGADGARRHCFFSLRENPWHQQGQIIQQPVGSPEAIRLAGLDWQVGLQGLYTDAMHPVEHFRAAVRSDTNATLGIVKDQFQIVQNTALFAWFDSLASEGVVYETAGALGAGETVWILARMPGEIRIGHDLTQTFMLVINGHGGNRMLTVAPTGVRVVCQNTLRLAERRIGRGRSRLEKGYRIRHSSGVKAALEDVAAAYGKTRASIATTQQAYEFLAKVPLTEALTTTVLRQTFRREDPAGVKVASTEADRAAAIRQAREERIRTILASSTCTGDGVAGSAYALLNAVTEFIDHERGTRTRRGQITAAQRFSSAHFGSGSLLKSAAWESIMEATHP